jgi:hypothetical protein
VDPTFREFTIEWEDGPTVEEVICSAKVFLAPHRPREFADHTLQLHGSACDEIGFRIEWSDDAVARAVVFLADNVADGDCGDAISPDRVFEVLVHRNVEEFAADVRARSTLLLDVAGPSGTRDLRARVAHLAAGLTSERYRTFVCTVLNRGTE